MARIFHTLRRLELGFKNSFKHEEIKAGENCKSRSANPAVYGENLFFQTLTVLICIASQNLFHFCSDYTSLFSVNARTFLTFAPHIFCLFLAFILDMFTHPAMLNMDPWACEICHITYICKSSQCFLFDCVIYDNDLTLSPFCTYSFLVMWRFHKMNCICIILKENITR